MILYSQLIISSSGFLGCIESALGHRFAVLGYFCLIFSSGYTNAFVTVFVTCMYTIGHAFRKSSGTKIGSPVIQRLMVLMVDMLTALPHYLSMHRNAPFSEFSISVEAVRVGCVTRKPIPLGKAFIHSGIDDGLLFLCKADISARLAVDEEYFGGNSLVTSIGSALHTHLGNATLFSSAFAVIVVVVIFDKVARIGRWLGTSFIRGHDSLRNRELWRWATKSIIYREPRFA
jgi:hypothetical protein